MKHKITEGKWRVHHNKIVEGESIMRDAPYQTCICECNDLIDEFEGNAKLIAAAPEMLSALKEFVGQMSNMTPKGRYSLGIHDLYDEAKSIIIKATY